MGSIKIGDTTVSTVSELDALILKLDLEYNEAVDNYRKESKAAGTLAEKIAIQRKGKRITSSLFEVVHKTKLDYFRLSDILEANL